MMREGSAYRQRLARAFSLHTDPLCSGVHDRGYPYFPNHVDRHLVQQPALADYLRYTKSDTQPAPKRLPLP